MNSQPTWPWHPPIWSAEYFDQQYNNRLRVPDFLQAYVQRWDIASKRVRDSFANESITYPDLFKLKGVDQTGQSLDVFRAAQPARPRATTQKPNGPVMVFIHGGYWRSLDKSNFSFIAEPYVQQGVTVVITNYNLCPRVSLRTIVLQQVSALVWVYRHIADFGGDPRQISVVGHSAGGHLAAMMAACAWEQIAPDLPPHLLRNAMSVSGLHDLAPLKDCPYLNQDLHLQPDEVQAASPIHLKSPRCPVVALCGADESEEFLRQNALLEAAWGGPSSNRAGVVREALLGDNHFSIVEGLANPEHRAYRWMQYLLNPAKTRP